jgi:hypothetical protein
LAIASARAVDALSSLLAGQCRLITLCVMAQPLLSDTFPVAQADT